jgi:hypothetical protein
MFRAVQAQLVEPIVLELHSRRETAVPIPRSCRMICAAEVTDRAVRGPQKKGCRARTLRRLHRSVIVIDDVYSRRTRTIDRAWCKRLSCGALGGSIDGYSENERDTNVASYGRKCAMLRTLSGRVNEHCPKTMTGGISSSDQRPGPQNALKATRRRDRL